MGTGDIWNGKTWHNKTIYAAVIGKSEAMLIGVVFRSLGMRGTIVPHSLKEVAATNQSPAVKYACPCATIGAFVPIIFGHCILGIGAKFSPNRMS